MRHFPARRPCSGALLALLLMAVLQACAGSKPARFYLLTAEVRGAAAQGVELDQPRQLIAVGPVELPRYLDRPQIVTRKGPNQLELAEFDLWAESLADNFAGVLIDAGLKAALPALDWPAWI